MMQRQRAYTKEEKELDNLKCWTINQYKSRNLNLCKMDLNGFKYRLEEAIKNDENLESIDIENSYELTLDEAISWRVAVNEAMRSGKLKKFPENNRICEYLRDHKHLMCDERKIEILKKWIYFHALHPFSGPILESLVQLAHEICNNEQILVNKSILFEQKRPIIRELIENNDNSILEIMGIQPDTLTRVICSKKIGDLKLIINSGLKVVELKYPEYKILRTPLHWALFCHNLDAFKALIQCGCEPVDETGQEPVFFNPAYKKTFNEAFILLNYKKAFDPTWTTLDFNQSDLLSSIYANLSNERIIQFYESLFHIGFSLSLKDGFGKSEFVLCMCQSNVNRVVMKYLLEKLVVELLVDDYLNNKVQIELTNTISYCVHMFCLEMAAVIERRNGLKEDFVVEIFKFIFPLVQARFELNAELVEFRTYPRYLVLASDVRSITEWNVNCLTYSGAFKMLDFLLKYGIVEATNVAFYLAMNFKMCPKLTVEYFCYLLENKFLECASLRRVLDEDIIRFPYIGVQKIKLSESFAYLERCVCLLVNFYEVNPRSLKFLAKMRVKEAMTFMSDANLRELELPRSLEIFIKSTEVRPDLNTTLDKIYR